MSNTSGKNLETRTLLDEFRNFDKEGFLDLGHPLLNRIAESFVKAAGVRFISHNFQNTYTLNQTHTTPPFSCLRVESIIFFTYSASSPDKGGELCVI